MKMNMLRRAVTAIGGITIVALVMALAVPRAVPGIVATLVQVTNTSANPVPVTPVTAKTVTVANFSRTLLCGTPDDEGPFDVSSYSTIRFIGVANISPEQMPGFSDSVQFQVNTLDSAGNQFPLDTLNASTPPLFGLGATVAASGAYQMPGNSVQLHITPNCSTSQVTAQLTILAR
jgi:hypothetical protein